MAKTVKTNQLPVVNDLTGAKVIGLDKDGKDAQFPLQNIVRSERGVATPAGSPTGTRFAGETWIVSTANLDVAYPNWGGLSVPSKVGEKYTTNNRFVWNNGAWTLERELVDAPSLTNVVAKSDVSTKSGSNKFVAGAVESKKSISTTFAIATGLADGFTISNKMTAIPGHVYRIVGRVSQFGVRWENSASALAGGSYFDSNFADVMVTAPAGSSSLYFGSSRDGDGQILSNIVVTDVTDILINAIFGRSILAGKVIDDIATESGQKLATELVVDSKVQASKVVFTFNQTNLFLAAGVAPGKSVHSSNFSITSNLAAGFTLSNRMKVTPGHSYRIIGRVSVFAVRWERTNGTLVNGVYFASNFGDVTVVAPAEADGLYFGSSRDADGQVLANIMVLDITATKLIKAADSNPILATKVVDDATNESGQQLATQPYVDNKLASNYTSRASAISFLGNVPFPDIKKYDICHIVEYGQSLSVGQESQLALTTVAIPRNFMLGSDVTANNSNAYNALVNNRNVEDLIVPMVNSFSTLFRKYVKENIDFLATSSGVGGTVIDQLMKVSLSGSTYYNSRFINHITNAKAGATSQGKTIACPAIIYVQGESDYGSKLNSVFNDAATTEQRIALYKQRLVQIKNDMQADIMATYGQAEPPIFFVHNPTGGWATAIDLFVHLAQIQACDENPDMILLGSPSFATRFANSHLSSNGYRWWGEMIAKYVFMTIVKGERSEPLRPKGYTINRNRIYIDYLVVNPPLQFDVFTVKQVVRYGYTVFVDGVSVDPLSIEIVGGNTVLLTMPNDLTPAASVQVNYSSRDTGNYTAGQGNLCDSDRWTSMYTYADDATEVSPADGTISYRPKGKDGNVITGKRYPMQNWGTLVSDKIK